MFYLQNLISYTCEPPRQCFNEFPFCCIPCLQGFLAFLNAHSNFPLHAWNCFQCSVWTKSSGFRCLHSMLTAAYRNLECLMISSIIQMMFLLSGELQRISWELRTIIGDLLGKFRGGQHFWGKIGGLNLCGDFQKLLGGPWKFPRSPPAFSWKFPRSSRNVFPEL